jgi:TM2 domain-containing membrane protein YozV
MILCYLWCSLTGASKIYNPSVGTWPWKISFRQLGIIVLYSLIMFCLYLKSIAKYIFVLWKVSFSVPKLDVKFTHLGEGLSVDNNVTGIHFTSTKSLPQDSVEEAMPHFDVQIDLSEIHVLLYCFI